MAAERDSPGAAWPFFALVFLLSLPFYLAGALFGRLPPQIPVALPVSALMAFVPVTATLLLSARSGGLSAVRALLGRVFDGARGGLRWHAMALLLMPALMAVEYVLLRSTGVVLPPPPIAWMAAPILFAMFFVAAAGETLGWQGYA